MKFYYNPKSQSLKILSLEKKTAIKSYFSDPQELKKRNCDKKYGITRAGQHLPLYGLEDGIGAERGRTRVLFTLWKGNIILLDYVTSHDYHKAPSMDRSYFSRFFASLQDGEQTLEALEELPMSPENSPVLWQPIGFDKNEQLIIPSEQQARVVAEQRYPMIIEGPAGSGKTFVLSMLCELLSQQEPSSLSQETKSQVFYLYPNDARLLGAQMQQYWAECYLTGDQALASGWDFHTQPVDESLPEALREPSIKGLEKHIDNLLVKRKSDLLRQKKTKAKLEAKALWDAWAILSDSQISASLLTQYMISLAVFRNYLSATFRLKDLFSSRAGIDDLMFDAFETVYQDDIALAPWFAPLLQALTLKADRSFDMLVIDEAQNISFAALAYLAWHTKEHRVIYSGDRDQAGHWESLSSLHLINLLLTQRGVMSKEQNKQLSEHYRCPAEVWEYTQHTLLPLREQLFGREYQRSPSPPQAEKSSSHALTYMHACEKNMGALQEFFAPIPEMSRDCFVIVSNVEKFEKFALEYLGGKKFIVLTPNQIAGLEAKVVVAFDLLDFDNIHKIARGEKTKRRLMKLSPEEETAYQQFNLFHVALTRSTEATLIIETKNNTRYQAHQHLFNRLRAPTTAHGSTYLSASPQELLSLYHQMASKSASAAQEFYQRYGHMFEALLEPQVDEVLPLKSEVQAPQSVTEMPIQDTIEMLAKKSSSWDESLPNLDAATIARLLFTPYGKKRSSTKTLFEKLAEQLDKKEKISSAAKKSKNLTTEQIVWDKFLKSEAYKKYINEDFYERQLPGKSGTIKQWLDSVAPDPWMALVTQQLSLGTLDCPAPDMALAPAKKEKIKNDTQQRAPLTSQKNEKKEPTHALPLSPQDEQIATPSSREEMRLLCGRIIESVVFKNIAPSSKNDPISQRDHRQFKSFIKAFMKYHQTLSEDLTLAETLKRLENLLYDTCVTHPYFWQYFTIEKMFFLTEITKNPLLFISPGDLSIFNNPPEVISYCSTDGCNIPLTFDTTVLKRGLEKVKQRVDTIITINIDGANKSSQEFVNKSINGMLTTFAYYNYIVADNTPYKRAMPYLIALHKIDPFFLERAGTEHLINNFVLDSFWLNKSPEAAALDFIDLLEQVMALGNINFVIKVLLPSTLKLNFDAQNYDKVNEAITNQFISLFRESVVNGTAANLNKIQKDISLYFNAINYSKPEITKNFKKMIALYAKEVPDFWCHLSVAKYELLRKITKQERLFWYERQTQEPESSLDFEPSCLKKAIDTIIEAKFDEHHLIDAMRGLSLVLQDYQHSTLLTQESCEQYGAPILLLLWRLSPDLLAQVPQEQLLVFLREDLYWNVAGVCPIVKFIHEIQTSEHAPSSAAFLSALELFASERGLEKSTDTYIERAPILLSQTGEKTLAAATIQPLI